MRIFIVLLIFILIPNAFAASIPVIGIHDDGQIDSSDYVQTILLTKQGLDDKVINSLAGMQVQGSGWELQKFSLGLGLTGEVGIGPFRYSSVLKQRFFYSRK